MNEVLSEVKKRVAEHGDLMFLTLTGSRLHGTATERSDVDVKGVYLPRLEGVLSGKKLKEVRVETGKGRKNTSKDVDVVVVPLQQFLSGVCSMESNALEMMFALLSPGVNLLEKTVLGERLGAFLERNLEELLSDDFGRLLGFARSMARRYVQKGERMREVRRVLSFLETLPEKDRLLDHRETLEGALEGLNKYRVTVEAGANDSKHLFFSMDGDTKKVVLKAPVRKHKEVLSSVLEHFGERSKGAERAGADWKAYAHALRAYRFVEDLLEKGRVEFPLSYADELLSVKRGERSVEEVEAELERLSKKFSLDSRAAKFGECNRGLVSRFFLEVYGCRG